MDGTAEDQAGKKIPSEAEKLNECKCQNFNEWVERLITLLFPQFICHFKAYRWILIILGVLQVYFCFNLILSNKSKGKKKECKVTQEARVWASGRVFPSAPPVMCWRSCSVSAELLPVEKVAYLRSFNQKNPEKFLQT